MTAVYEAGPLKTKRRRATKNDMEERYQAIERIVTSSQPTGIRFVYYRMVVAGLVPKTDSGYTMVQKAILKLRRYRRIPYEHITDSTRWMRKPDSWSSINAFLEDVGSSYRKNLWRDARVIVEVWAESDSIAGVIFPVTGRWDVPLYPCKGQSSDTLAYGAAQAYRYDTRPVHIYYVGDRDPAGMEIEANLLLKLRDHAERPDLFFTRLACTPEQIEQFDLPGTPPKKPTWKNPITGEDVPLGGLAVEVEALEVEYLRDLVEDAIVQHIDPHQLTIHNEVEAQERAGLQALIEGGAW